MPLSRGLEQKPLARTTTLNFRLAARSCRFSLLALCPALVLSMAQELMLKAVGRHGQAKPGSFGA